jgi:hypothetical protein
MIPPRAWMPRSSRKFTCAAHGDAPCRTRAPTSRSEAPPSAQGCTVRRMSLDLMDHGSPRARGCIGHGPLQPYRQARFLQRARMHRPCARCPHSAIRFPPRARGCTHQEQVLPAHRRMHPSSCWARRTRSGFLPAREDAPLSPEDGWAGGRGSSPRARMHPPVKNAFAWFLPAGEDAPR